MHRDFEEIMTDGSTSRDAQELQGIHGGLQYLQVCTGTSRNSKRIAIAPGIHRDFEELMEDCNTSRYAQGLQGIHGRLHYLQVCSGTSRNS
jgi:hypothetical protein